MYKSVGKRAPISFVVVFLLLFFFLWSTVIGHALGLFVPTTKDETKKKNEINVTYTRFRRADTTPQRREWVSRNKFQLTSSGSVGVFCI